MVSKMSNSKNSLNEIQKIYYKYSASDVCDLKLCNTKIYVSFNQYYFCIYKSINA